MTLKKLAAIGIPTMALALGVSTGAQAQNLVTNGEFNQFTQGGNNEFIADYIGSPDTILTGWTNNRPFMALYGPNAAELTGATAPDVGGTIYLAGPLNGNPNGFADVSPNQLIDPTANFIAADADPTFPGTGISQTIGTSLIAGQQYTLSYNWAAAQDEGENGGITAGWTVTLGTQTLVDETLVNATILSQGFSGWNTESLTFTYTGGPSDLLSFLVVGSPSGLPPVALLDSVSLVEDTGGGGTTGTLPEPSAVVLLTTGMLGLVAMKLRRRAKPAAA